MKGRHKPTYKWLKWLIPDWMLLYSQHSNWKFPMCFFLILFPCFHFPKFCLSSLSSPFMWVISTPIITPIGESSSSVWAGIVLKYYLTQSDESVSSMTGTIFHSPMGIMMLRREAQITKTYSSSCHFFELDCKLLRAGTLFVMCL